MRDTPVDIEDSESKYSHLDRSLDEPAQMPNFRDDQNDDGSLSPSMAQRIAREAFEASTQWLASSRRSKWSDSLKAFNSQHPSGSKYLSREYAGRSNLYRPKTRTMVRKGEASTATAFFSNEDVISVKADDDDDPRQQASAEVLKALIQYRLTKTIPWFQTLVGARQDAEVMGICVAKAYWSYKEKSHGVVDRAKLDSIHEMPLFHDDGSPETEEQERYEVLEDKPCIDLISPENIRYDPSSDWRDPITTSPYVIENIPMFYQDVMDKITSGEWYDVGDGALRKSLDLDSTKIAREQGRQPSDMKEGPTAFSTCWIRSNIIRWGEQDYHFFTVGGAGELLTDPQPLEEVYLHGMRPYVVGTIVLETHRNFPSSKIELTRDLQRIANDDLNLRFDAVKMSLNPRQFISAGGGIEPNDLRSFVPGKVIQVKNVPKGETPNSVVGWDRPPEPGQSAYMEAQQNQLDFDELTGAFTNSSVQASQWSQQSATGMHLMSGEASGVSEYELRVFAETFVEPLLRMLIKLEQAYETDEIILATAGNKAQLFQRFGIDKVTDDLLQAEVTTKVNVGIGATNPAMRLRAFGQASQILQQVFASPTAVMGLNFHEIVKEIMANAGYRDGERFIKPGFDPQKAMMEMEQAKQPQNDQGQAQAQARVQAASIQAQAKQQDTQMRADLERQKLAHEMAKTQLQEDGENWRTQYQQDHEAWSSAVPQQMDAVNNALGQIGPSMVAMQQAHQVSQQQMIDHATQMAQASHAAMLQQQQASHAAIQAHQQAAIQHQASMDNLLQHAAAGHAQTSEQLAQLTQHVATGHAATNQHLQHLASQIAAPKRVVRGKDGKVEGVETVPPKLG